MSYRICFESNAQSGYIHVLAESTVLAHGLVATQNAGSSNPGIYYQVGGAGRNGDFAEGLGTGATDTVNRALAAAYDARYGKGSWQADQSTAREDRLTSFYIPIPRPLPARPAVGGKPPPVGDRIAGMVYSVGPVIHRGKIGDRDQYRQIYVDALLAVAAVNAQAAAGAARIEGLRLTMLSTGLYSAGLPPADAAKLASDAADLILEALEQAAKTDGAHVPGTILINTQKPTSKEIDAYSEAARKRGLKVDAQGFVL
ncbi:MAG: hypothetical protein JNN03_19380 [Rubrivivax sp.]|nr:hypothetical protein [Rubrivivax sp.]